MKKKPTKIKLNMFKYLLFLPILLLSFCDSNLGEPTLSLENKLTKDAKVLSLIKSAIQGDLDQNSIKNKDVLSKSTSTDDDRCTYFLYPMTFEVYSGDNPEPETREINSDEELISFIDILIASTSNYEFYIFFPITLLDTDGVETVLTDLNELEGTLQMAIEACASFTGDDESDDGSDDGSNDGSDDSSNDGSDDESDDGSDDGSNDGSDDSSNDGSDDGSDDESDDGSNDGSDDSSNDGSDDSPDDENDDSNDDSDDHCGENNKKVYICHKGKTICVSVNAIWGHMQHHEEDYLGRCDD